MKRNCLDCGQSLRGRRDKKYCSDQCRNNHHNKRGRRLNNLVRRINRRLSVNRRILWELNPTGNNTIDREILEYKGFDFNLHTEIHLNPEGNTCYFCYEQGYLFLSDMRLMLISRDYYRQQQRIGKKRSGVARAAQMTNSYG